MVWIFTLASVIGVSLLSFIGLITIRQDEEKMKPFLLVLVSFSAGALLGDVFLHVLPEAVAHRGFSLSISLWILGGVLIFFVLEKFVQWHHCHFPQAHVHGKPLAFMNLIGDGLHNFIDGVVIAGSYLVSMPVGLATTIAVILHEIPQELGDFGVLMHGGFTRQKALLFNFLSAVTAILGALVVLFFTASPAPLLEKLLPFTAGSFLYIAGVDLLPELHKEQNPLPSLIQFLSFIAGMAIMLALLLLG